MKTLIRIAVALAVLFVVLIGSAFLLPRTYRVERSIEIAAPAAEVFRHVGDLRAWSGWTAWAEMDPEMESEFSENSTGVGAWQQWSGPKVGNGRLELTATEPPRLVRYDLFFPDYDMRSAGEIVLAPTVDGAGVVVTWTDSGDVGFQPFMRWFALLFDRMIGGDFETGLAKLKQLTERAVVVPTTGSGEGA
ncbi:SRPBCC family protein [Opitutales bacterium ASA1]|uniref:SRPBCC family protein n=1 Tax=Congregicoccus parvus TaxID=3081749 RepID=UPI002B2FCE0F|nr:SRPBCC family protein [Opitutales bacterium ASA1]